MMKKSGYIFLIMCMVLILNVLNTDQSVAQTDKSTTIILGQVDLAPREATVRGGGRYGRPVRANTAAAASNDSVIVWLETPTQQEKSQNDGIIILDQVDLKFNPSLVPVVQNGTIRIRNSDPVYHNVFSLSSTKRFDVGRRPKGEYLDVKFDKTGTVDVFCDIHSNMRATILVMPTNVHSWLKIKNGETFTFTDIPEGNVLLKVFASGYSESSQTITVTKGEPVDLGTITLNF